MTGAALVGGGSHVQRAPGPPSFLPYPFNQMEDYATHRLWVPVLKVWFVGAGLAGRRSSVWERGCSLIVAYQPVIGYSSLMKHKAFIADETPFTEASPCVGVLES